ncbi:septal ring lytic transglycosylase RlpA family protein [Azospirillum thermophilum]|uniref:Endolytic peptidoglycan transglycosylase RlpA n=1 Tax=Azospirillum thermophilum TaxID=2202148 RepID=A0A2S2CQ53_9PROT|nr:septal ring lytic transglycosylase RlpA family protein [Azospirillum thermophilum]AWK86447.1 septal ring lytic transglycosylase RlpA family lipoprotein [Azospirillum thermophilum]
MKSFFLVNTPRITARILVAALCALPLATPALAKDKARTPALKVERANGEPVIVHQGKASFYGGKFHGRKTASGERMNQNKRTAASRVLPLGTKATVTNQENGKSVEVIVNDRGPYVGGRVIDLSRKAAHDLGMVEDGVVPVRVEAKPSEQPTEEVKEKVEAKAVATDPRAAASRPVQVAERPDESSGGSRGGRGAAGDR